jgi:hypothetical protein
VAERAAGLKGAASGPDARRHAARAEGIVALPRGATLEGAVSHEPISGGDYLDAIFTSIRAFARELDTSRRWLSRAEQTENQAWRLSFLREARAAYERAPARLAALVDRLGALGSSDALPAPLDRLHQNLATMRRDLATHEERLLRLETREAQAGAPVGRA